MNEWNGPNYCVKDGRARAPHTWWTIELFNLSKNFARAALNVKEKKKNSSPFFKEGNNNTDSLCSATRFQQYQVQVGESTP